MVEDTVLDELITGRVEPHIYAFTTETIPNYLKVGDTYRPVNVRLNEWKEHFPKLEKQFEDSAKINDDVYFRDFSVHQFLETDKKRVRLQPVDISSGIYYSKEFFKDATVTDVVEAITDIKNDFNAKSLKYQFYNVVDHLPEEQHYARIYNYEPRKGTQDVTIANFRNAVANGRTNLLMYAVMRFGKSFTSMCCAVEMDAKLVVIVSGKADVQEEWKKTVESHLKFKDYEFVTQKDFQGKSDLIKEQLKANRKVVAFLTLQDLQGETIKDKHKEVFGEQIDLLIVDETHFGARAEKYGQVLKAQGYEKDIKNKKDNDDFVDIEEAETQLKVLNAKICLHLSGTPYRILMGSEFKDEDIIAFYQFADIVQEQQKWIEENNNRQESEQQEEWDNPYYGFPQMVRFAFSPNKSAREKLSELKKDGISYAFSALLKPLSIKKDGDGKHKKFVFEKEVLDFLQVIDGSKNDEELLGFLDCAKLKNGKMCRHIVMVLPYCASCDAMENLIENNKDEFKNLKDYEIVNISGVDNPNRYRKINDVKNAIRNFEKEDRKTITLTVNRMLTGSTVPEWDTMLFLKDTASPQEYDQAIFRLQNQYIKTYSTEDGKIIKYNMKPQTLLVDFMPNRMFVMQEQKAQIYNVNTDEGGNDKLKERIAEELKISPVVTLNRDRLTEVQASDILSAVSNYKMDKGIKDEALEIPVDLGVLEKSSIKTAIEQENEIGSSKGLTVPAHKSDDEHSLDLPSAVVGYGDGENCDNIVGNNGNAGDISETDEEKWRKSNIKKIQNYYTRILLFAFITNDKIISLCEVLKAIEDENNKRIAKNLGLQKAVLQDFYDFYHANNKWALSKLDYKIQDLNSLSHSDLPADRKANVAVKKFGKLGDAIVITPSNICDDMVNLFPDDFMAKIAENGGRILDIAGTSGEYATAIVKKMTSLGVGKDRLNNIVYTIPKSSVCYELIRKVYGMLGLNTDNIASFYAEDLLKIKNGNELDYDKITKILRQNKPFNEITLEDNVEGETDMTQFNAIIGNPPYQVEGIGGTNGKDPIYHLFIDLSKEISKFGYIIHPARFLFNAGKTPKEWNKKILSDEHFRVVNYFADSSEVFPTVDIKGGVAITEWNKELNFGAIGIYTAYQELNAIMSKVITDKFESFSELVYPRDLYRLNENFYDENPWAIDRPSKGHKYDVGSNVFEIFPELFTDEKPIDGEYAQIMGRLKNERVLKWIKKSYLKTPDNFDYYKVFVPKANGSGAIGEVLSTPVVGHTVVGHTVTFLSIGKFETLQEAEAVQKYIKSKFARTMLGTLKVTQDNPKEVWFNVPMQDFTSKSDIDWSKSIPEIDRQLYKKYGLEQSEIDFIEKMIKPME